MTPITASAGYEVAGASHIDRWAYDRGFPTFADQTASGGAPQGDSRISVKR